MRYVVPTLVLVQLVLMCLRYVGTGLLAVLGVVMWEIWPWLLFVAGFIVGAALRG